MAAMKEIEFFPALLWLVPKTSAPNSEGWRWCDTRATLLKPPPQSSGSELDLWQHLMAQHVERACCMTLFGLCNSTIHQICSTLLRGAHQAMTFIANQMLLSTSFGGFKGAQQQFFWVFGRWNQTSNLRKWRATPIHLSLKRESNCQVREVGDSTVVRKKF